MGSLDPAWSKRDRSPIRRSDRDDGRRRSGTVTGICNPNGGAQYELYALDSNRDSWEAFRARSALRHGFAKGLSGGGYAEVRIESDAFCSAVGECCTGLRDTSHPVWVRTRVHGDIVRNRR